MREVDEAEWNTLRDTDPEDGGLAGGIVHSRMGSKDYIMDYDLGAGEWIRLEVV